MDERRAVTHFYFTGAGQQSVAVASNEHISVYQLDISPLDDTNVEIRIGTAVIFHGNVKKDFPFQLFFIDFGLGRGTGVKGDDMVVQVGAAAHVFVAHIITVD